MVTKEIWGVGVLSLLSVANGGYRGMFSRLLSVTKGRGIRRVFESSVTKVGIRGLRIC